MITGKPPGGSGQPERKKKMKRPVSELAEIEGWGKSFGGGTKGGDLRNPEGSQPELSVGGETA